MRFSWLDLLDIAIVSYILYRLFLLIKGTRAVQLLRGLIVLLVFYYAADWLELRTIKFLMQNAGIMVIVAIPIVFQPEMRRALAHLGQGRTLFPSEPMFTKGKEFFELIDTLVVTARQLSTRRIGALIVIERETGLNEYVETGTPIDAKLSSELLLSIFLPASPIHDGAIIVRGTRLVVAGAVLPLSENMRAALSPRQHLGTRHRAALGLSEVSDAICLIVSEETGDISVALQGRLHRHLSEESLQKLLLSHFQPEVRGTSPLTPLLRGLGRRES
ncbi:MAG: TIGR00159 family protein [Candidatus Sericytochromatia bacterium]|nr:TIGR00159 family protein [Candidatus Sericytochromatia bacterium]